MRSGSADSATILPSSEFLADFPPDAKYLYRRGVSPRPERFMRGYQVKLEDGREGPWLAGMTARYAALLKVVDRGSILLVVYTAFSMGVVKGIWKSVDVWRLVSVTIVGGGNAARSVDVLAKTSARQPVVLTFQDARRAPVPTHVCGRSQPR